MLEQTTPLLRVESLRIGFLGAATDAVEDVSFSIFPGKTLALVGESGSGKSLTALSILQLLPHSAHVRSGKVTFASDKQATSLLSNTEQEMQRLRGRDISMVFQEPMTALNPSYSCGKQVAEVVKHHLHLGSKEAKKRVIKWFERVKLPEPHDAFEKYPHQLSGGQKQRVMIAMAMCCKPSLLIADEPTTALDVTVQRAVLELMKELQLEYKMGILFITHDLGVVNEIADDVAVMYRGKIVETGYAKEVLKTPQHPYTKGLIGCRPPIDYKPHRLPVIADFIDGNPIKQSNNQTKPIPTSSQNIILRVQDLSARFVKGRNFLGKPTTYHEAVKKVSFSLYKGETLGLVGESGCGKTTLGRSILRLVERVEGSVSYKGKNINTLSAAELRKLRRKIQLIFQDPYSSLNPRLTVGEAILEPMMVHQLHSGTKESKAKVMELLTSVGLTNAAFNKYPHEFSGGQRQRIGIARALALEPEIIICDESVSALDMSVQAQVLNLLNTLKEQFSLTYLFISHDLSVVKYMSDRLIIMNKGSIEETGDAGEIYRNPQSPYTKKLIDAIPKMG
jgi:peptide/nickel transport system ATP-binding protein